MSFSWAEKRGELKKHKGFLVNCGLSWLHDSQFVLGENNKANARETQNNDSCYFTSTFTIISLVSGILQNIVDFWSMWENFKLKRTTEINRKIMIPITNLSRASVQVNHLFSMKAISGFLAISLSRHYLCFLFILKLTITHANFV